MATKSISQLDSAVSLALGDLFEIAEPDAQSQTGYASKKISLSQEAAFIQENVQSQNLNTTNKTLVGAINEVDSEGVKWSENNVLGAKNLLKYPYYNNSQVLNGITWTVNSDGTITAKGTATANSQFILHTRSEGELNDFTLPNGNYILSDGGLQNANTEIQMGITKNGAYFEVAITRNGDVQFTANGDDYSQNSINPVIYCLVRSGQQNINVTFKPMIRLASIADNTFEPYAQTNVELTAEKMAWNDSTEYGVKNLIPYPWSSEAKSGRINRGITFTYDEEGYITLNGTADSTNQPYMCFTLSTDAAAKLGNVLVIEGNRKYTLSIDRTDNRLFAMIYIRNTSGASASVATRAVYEDGTVRELTTDFISLLYSSVFHKEVTFEILTSGSYRLQVDLRVNNNSGSYTNAKGRVILQDAQISDTSWMPYAMSNYELTLNKMDVVNIAPIEEGNSASQAYAIGDYMIWKRRFYKVTAAISSGGAITEGTNVTQTTIGAELKAALT